MKKILATLLACGLAMQTCAFASVSDMSATYDKGTSKITVNAKVGSDAGTPVIVSVIKDAGNDNTETVSATNLPQIMYLYNTEAGGALNEDINIWAGLTSGKYIVKVNYAGGNDSKKLMVVNTQDTAGTVAVMNSLRDASTGAEVASIIADVNSMDKLGIDPDFMAERNAYTGYAGEILFAEQSGDWTVSNIDEFITRYNRALVLSSAKAGKNVDKVMELYDYEFGETYEVYVDYEEDYKKYITSQLKNIDYTGDIPAQYDAIFELIDYKIADAWGELRDAVNADREAGTCPFDFSLYDDIDVERQQDVFERFKPVVQAKLSKEDMATDFYNITYAVLEEQYNAESGDATPVPTQAVPDVPAGNKGDVITGGGGGGGYDPKPSATPTVAPTAAPVATEAPVLEAGVFGDTADHWAKDYIKTLATNGVVGGYDDGTFGPNKNVTRAEYIKMIVGMFGLEESAENIFTDVADDAWYKEYVEKAVAAGLIQGDGGNFNPDATITRQDAAVILYRLGIAAGETEVEFSDEANVADYAKDAVEVLASAGIINGSDGKFNPANAITRAETAAILCRAAEAPTDEPVDEPVDEPTDEPVDEPADENTDETVEDESAEETTGDETVNE